MLLTVHGAYYYSIIDQRDEELIHLNHVSGETPLRPPAKNLLASVWPAIHPSFLAD